jgi:hypothetical protein
MASGTALLRTDDIPRRSRKTNKAEHDEQEAQARPAHLPGEQHQHAPDHEAEHAMRRELIALDREEGGHGYALVARPFLGPDEEERPAGQRRAHENDQPFVGSHVGSSMEVGGVEKEAYTKREPAWSLDRRVPLAVILTIAMQTAAALLWAGAAGERLTALEARTERIGELVERTARLEEQTKSANASIRASEARLGR